MLGLLCIFSYVYSSSLRGRIHSCIMFHTATNQHRCECTVDDKKVERWRNLLNIYPAIRPTTPHRDDMLFKWKTWCRGFNHFSHRSDVHVAVYMPINALLICFQQFINHGNGPKTFAFLFFICFFIVFWSKIFQFIQEVHLSQICHLVLPKCLLT